MGSVPVGFHDGELLVQRRAGVAADAARLEGMLTTPRLDRRTAQFLAERDFAVLTSRAADGRLWVVPLLGAPGFLRVDGATLTSAVAPDPQGPLAGLPPGQAAGLITVEFSTRRRFRVNGR